jgi:hypothetical protein
MLQAEDNSQKVGHFVVESVERGFKILVSLVEWPYVRGDQIQIVL